MFYEFTSRLTLNGALETLTALRIGASKSTSPAEPDLPVVKDALGRPYIPGSSFKGVLRSHVEAMLRGLLGDDGRLVCNPTNNDEWCIVAGKDRNGKAGIDSIKKDDQERNREDAEVARQVMEKSCLVCQLFGSPWLASRLQVRDLLVDGQTWFGQFQERNGVAIDRGKEIAADGKLYDFEVVPAGARFHFAAIVENADPWQLGMLMAGLRPFTNGDVAICGGRSRGLGLVRLDLAEKMFIDAANREALLDALIEGSGGESVSESQIREWREAFREKMRNMMKQEGEHA